MSPQPDLRCHVPPPQNLMQLMGFLQTTHGQPSFSSPSCCRGRWEIRAVTAVGAVDVDVDVGIFPAFPCRVCAQACTSGGRRLAGQQGRFASFATAPLAIHNHKAIFGWAANLFLAAATSQTTTAEKSGPARLGDPVPGRGDVDGHRSAAPSPCLPAAHIPHPTIRAWPGLPSLGVLPKPWYAPAPAQPTPPGPCSSVFIYLLHPPLPARLCIVSDSFSLILSLSTFLTTSR